MATIHSMSRKLGVTTLVLVVILMLFGLLGLRIRQDLQEANGPIYTLSQVEDGLDHHPEALVGKVVRVRASIISMTSACRPSATTCSANTFYLLVNTLSDSF